MLVRLVRVTSQMSSIRDAMRDDRPVAVMNIYDSLAEWLSLELFGGESGLARVLKEKIRCACLSHNSAYESALCECQKAANLLRVSFCIGSKRAELRLIEADEQRDDHATLFVSINSDGQFESLCLVSNSANQQPPFSEKYTEIGVPVMRALEQSFDRSQTIQYCEVDPNGVVIATPVSSNVCKWPCLVYWRQENLFEWMCILRQLANDDDDDDDDKRSSTNFTVTPLLNDSSGIVAKSIGMNLVQSSIVDDLSVDASSVSLAGTTAIGDSGLAMLSVFCSPAEYVAIADKFCYSLAVEKSIDQLLLGKFGNCLHADNM